MDERNLKPMQIIRMDELKIGDVFAYEIKLRGRACFEVVDRTNGVVWAENRVSKVRSKVENISKKSVVWLRKI